jgi:hypothetical protein
MRRPLRLFGTLFIAAGLLSLARAALVWQWHDPFTYLSNRYEQRKLEASYEAEARRFASTLTAPAPASDTIEAESPEAVRASWRRRRGATAPGCGGRLPSGGSRSPASASSRWS